MRAYGLLAIVVVAACSGTVQPGDPVTEDGGPKDASKEASGDANVIKDGSEEGDASTDAEAVEDADVEDGDIADALDAESDAGPIDAGPPDVTCKTDAGPIAIVDAGILDSGTTSGLCLGCARANCAAKVAACEADCECRDDLTYLFSCIKSGGSTSSCGTSLRFNTAQGTSLVDCVITGSCASACAYP